MLYYFSCNRKSCLGRNSFINIQPKGLKFWDFLQKSPNWLIATDTLPANCCSGNAEPLVATCVLVVDVIEMSSTTYDLVLPGTSLWFHSVPRRQKSWCVTSCPWGLGKPDPNTGHRRRSPRYPRPCQGQLKNVDQFHQYALISWKIKNMRRTYLGTCRVRQKSRRV